MRGSDGQGGRAEKRFLPPATPKFPHAGFPSIFYTNSRGKFNFCIDSGKPFIYTVVMAFWLGNGPPAFFILEDNE